MRPDINTLNNQNWLTELHRDMEKEKQEKVDAENAINRMLITMISSMNKAGELPQEFKQMLNLRADAAISKGSQYGAQIKQAIA